MAKIVDASDFLIKDTTSGNDAAETCRKYGKSIARIETEKEIEEVKTMMHSAGISTAWFGLIKKKTFVNNYLYFSDVSVIQQFMRWENGSYVTSFDFDLEELGFYQASWSCVVVDISSVKAKLVDGICSLKKRVLCLKSELISYAFSVFVCVNYKLDK